MTTKISAIIRAIDEFLEKNHLDTCTPVEVSPILEKLGLLADRSDRPGLPLRILLRDGKVPHAYQIGRYWHIPHSSMKTTPSNLPKSMKQHQEDVGNRPHSFEPSVGKDPKILILGSIPGKESLRMNQYYAKAGNRFWGILAKVLDVPMPVTYHDKIEILHENGIALWDVLASAEREGSMDINIKNEKPNDIITFLHKHPSIKTVGFNGKKAYETFCKHFGDYDMNVKVFPLRSTSPANRQFSDTQMIEDWSRLFQ